MNSSERAPCDFCGERTAVLFCRADAAKLCLPCDHHVLKANLLSRKHVRQRAGLRAVLHRRPRIVSGMRLGCARKLFPCPLRR
ncbi:BnaCnng16420D [Brassica napus]|uniref:BnaCnng16420D protein n=1 Tax=Brassica napus TaxID=3708 RepID=A0A078IGA7_BRANA|nr:BnaCnng16420D [Brassica napus]